VHAGDVGPRHLRDVEPDRVHLEEAAFVLFLLLRPFEPRLVVPKRVGEQLLLLLGQRPPAGLGDELANT